MLGNNSEFIPKPKLAQSNFHHESMGSSHRHKPDTEENRHRPAHEFLTDWELRWRIAEEIADVRGALADFRNAEDPEKKKKAEKTFLLVRDKFLFPNLHYLVAIGRLPDDISVSGLKEELCPVNPG